MTELTREMLKRLGAGAPIASICAEAGIDRGEFDRLWKATAAARVPASTGRVLASVGARVEIERDAHGIPHIYAARDADLFFGFGFATGQDRLFQLDYLRRKASGRLAEILGPSALELDLVARTIGLRRIAEAEWKQLNDETRALVEAYSAGLNALIDATRENPPIEFDLLDYRPEPWSPVDCLAIECEFRWYLTGRFPIIVMPELAKRTLGDGPLYRDFLLAEADDECILPAGTYPRTRVGIDPLGPALGLDRARRAAGVASATAPSAKLRGESHAAPRTEQRGGSSGSAPLPPGGSNNWVVSGALAASGKPLVASDPHIAFEAVSCWHEVHLSGGSFQTAGMAYVGMPAVMFGRNEHVAWGMTNNICSQRDLYQEQTSPEHPGCYLFNGEWEPALELEETIAVRGQQPVVKTIRFSRNGPIVDEILPPPGNATGPVSIRWLGSHAGGWLTALLQVDRAADAAAFREALRPWHVPTFSVVYADVDGTIGYQAAGRVPVRGLPERGYRPGWDPAHQWEGLTPFEGMPSAINPERGWLATANNRPAPDDFPYPLAGCWVSGHRAQRIRDVLDSLRTTAAATRDTFRDLHQDPLSYHARDHLAPVCRVLAEEPDERAQAAVKLLSGWNAHCDPDAAAPTLFNVFFTKWCETVAGERFDPPTAALLVNGIDALAFRLLADDPHGWFARGNRAERMREAFRSALAHLAERFGPDVSTWTWGRLHKLPLKHVLSARGELSQLLKTTVCNTGQGPDWVANTGAGYRLIAELENNPPGLWAVDAQSQSGHPGSTHYADQLDDWLSGRYHFLPLDGPETRPAGRDRLTLEP